MQHNDIQEPDLSKMACLSVKRVEFDFYFELDNYFFK